MDLPDLLKIPDVADYLDISESHARKLCRTGEIEALMPGNRYLVTREDLADFVERQKLRKGA